MSPEHFNIYINDFIAKLRMSDRFFRLAGVYCACLLLAEDIL